MRLFSRRKGGDEGFLETAANVMLGDQSKADEFRAIGEIGGRLIADTWSLGFIEASERRSVMAEFPDTDVEFDAFLRATRGDPRRAAEIRQPWFAAWLHGYFLGLARLHRENVELGRVPPHAWQRPALAEYAGTWARLTSLGTGEDVDRIDRELEWMGHGALAPFSARVMLGALSYISGQEDEELMAHYEVGESRLRALMTLRVTAGHGYALARAQQENALMTQYLDRLEAG